MIARLAIGLLGGALCLLSNACAPTTHPVVAAELRSGIPSQPDLVTVVPFYTKPNETQREQTKVVIEATVDGHRGVFIFDTGAEELWLNRTYLQPNSQGGVDTVTDATRIPDHTPRVDYLTPEVFTQFDKANVTVQIGTITYRFADSSLTAALGGSYPHTKYNAMLGHLWGDFGWVFAPRLGNIGPEAIESFEAIVDYTHRRIVFIRLDSAGHRMAKVSAYTPRWTESLLGVRDPANAGRTHLKIKVGPGDMLDTLNAANNTILKFIDTGASINVESILGYPFLHQFGAFGINQRTHQFILYH